MMPEHDIPEARRFSGLFSYKSLHYVYQQMIDLVFPPRCQHCGRVDSNFCATCETSLNLVPINIVLDNIAPMLAVASTGVHSNVLQSSVQALKYNRGQSLGKLHAQRLKTVLDSLDWRVDFIIPVPLHEARLKERGYNQAKEISEPLAEMCNVIHEDNVLIRTNQTRSQVGLNRVERLDNVKGAFVVSSSILIDKTVLLVDDVKTTGATMSACADALLSSGAKAVYGISVTTAS